MRHDRWIIECRDKNGKLDFADPQPESVFGMGAIYGLTDHDMSQPIFRAQPEVILTGDSIPFWPRLLDQRWTARRKTW